MMAGVLTKLIAREDLTREEMAAVMTQIADGAVSAPAAAAFLATLRAKGETVVELAAAVEVLRARVDPIRVDAPIFIDTCGTGGDGQNTFNISTTAAFVVAACGIAVAKHGNRSISSRSGSADVLAALGVQVEASKEVVERCIREVGIGFMFAPRLHPAFKAVAPIRQALGVRTMFNLMGPLVNPAGARRQVMGVYDSRWVPIVGNVLAALGADDALVVHGEGLDEIAITGTTRLARALRGTVTEFTVTPEEMGLKRWPLSALAGGDAAHNADITRRVLSGEAGAPRDAVLANAAGGLLVGGAVASLAEGVVRAAQAIDSGAAREKLEALVRVSQ